MSESIDTLLTASCETSVTHPPMFLMLPRKLSTLLLMLSIMAAAFVETWTMGISLAIIIPMVWFAVREQVANDLWGFDNFCAWTSTDLRFLDSGGADGWGGAKLCALPLAAAPLGIDRNAAR